MSKTRQTYWKHKGSHVYELRSDLCATGIKVRLEPQPFRFWEKPTHWRIVIDDHGVEKYVPRPSVRHTPWIGLQTAKLWGRYWRRGFYKWEPEIAPIVEVSAQ